MDKKPVIFIIGAAVIIIMGFFIYFNFEIYSRQVTVFPSRDAIGNNYLAMERWLTTAGYAVRIQKKITPAQIMASAEKVVALESAFCEWEKAGELLPWITNGGFLVISLVDEWYKDAYLTQFLADWGIAVQEESFYEESGDDDDAIVNIDNEDVFPEFDSNIFLQVDENEHVFTMEDRGNDTRLVRISAGNGSLTVTGRMYFMFNNRLKEKTNARLAWNVTGAQAQEGGILFVRDIRLRKGLLGKIADRGNLLPLAVSVLIVIITGFWMVIPVFGLVFDEQRQRAMPIRERFRTEIYFLKKYGALDHYVKTYLHEIRLSLGGIAPEDAIVEVERELQAGKLHLRDIITMLKKLEKRAFQNIPF